MGELARDRFFQAGWDERDMLLGDERDHKNPDSHSVVEWGDFTPNPSCSTMDMLLLDHYLAWPDILNTFMLNNCLDKSLTVCRLHQFNNTQMSCNVDVF
uniref:Uncharacterized protein n=1 Tax=Arion vulgaris TaxID=1028688 RepID=A0A0B7B3X6_9EUPU